VNRIAIAAASLALTGCNYREDFPVPMANVTQKLELDQVIACREVIFDAGIPVPGSSKSIIRFVFRTFQCKLIREGEVR